MRLSNLQCLNALLYVAEHGAKWCSLPEDFGNWHAIYTRMNRWSKNGVLDRIFEKLQVEQTVGLRIEAIALDSTPIKMHPDGTVLEINGPQAIGKSRGGWTTEFPLVAADARTAVSVALLPGNAHDAPEGRELLRDLPPMPEGLPLLMDRAYEGMRPGNWRSISSFGPSCHPKPTAAHPGATIAHSTPNATIERLFRRSEGYRRIFSHFDKLDAVFLGFTSLAFIVETLR